MIGKTVTKEFTFTDIKQPVATLPLHFLHMERELRKDFGDTGGEFVVLDARFTSDTVIMIAELRA